MSHADKLAEALERVLESSEHLLDAVYAKKHIDVIQVQDDVNDIEVFKARKALADYNASKVGDDELLERVKRYLSARDNATHCGDEIHGIVNSDGFFDLLASDIRKLISRLQSLPTTKD